MIKFFRKIRQKLLTENQPAGTGRAGKFSKPASRTGRYLLYAMGEILLVVIGIMIALGVNNKNQERAQEKEIKAILIEIQRDISRDIAFSDYFIGDFIRKDSIKNLVMNNQVSYDDIKNEKSESRNVSSLAYKYTGMKLSTNGYKQFSNKIDKMPEKYNDLVLWLNDLYQFNVPDIEYDFSRYRDHVHQNISEAYNQLEWRAQEAFDGDMSEEMINYMLNDPQFKRDVMNIFHDANNLVRALTRYRPFAIFIYFVIDEMLDGEGYETKDHMRNYSLADSIQAAPLVGYYEQIAGPLDFRLGRTIEITSKGKQLYLNTQDKEEIHLQYLNAFKMRFYIPFTSTILKFNQNENEDLTIIGGRLDERKWRKVLKNNE